MGFIAPSFVSRVIEFRPQGRARIGVWALVLAGCAAAWAAHYLTGSQLDLGSAFLIPSIAAAWYLGSRAGLATVAISAAAWLAATLMTTPAPPVPVAVLNALSRFAIFVLVVVLLAQLRELLSRLREMSRTDALTGLANLRALRERGEHDLETARRMQTGVSLIFIDIDDFKEVNDRHGHAAGDRVLCDVGHALREVVRRTDFAARLGGDEFAVLLVGSGSEAAKDVAAKIRSALRSLLAGGHAVTVSMGIASAAGEATFDELLEAGDALMYEAKDAGKDAIAARSIGQISDTCSDLP